MGRRPATAAVDDPPVPAYKPPVRELTLGLTSDECVRVSDALIHATSLVRARLLVEKTLRSNPVLVRELNNHARSLQRVALQVREFRKTGFGRARQP